MKLDVFRIEATRCILAERERAARICDDLGCSEAADRIRAARAPEFHITSHKYLRTKPELMQQKDLLLCGLTAWEVYSGNHKVLNYDPDRPCTIIEEHAGNPATISIDS